MTIQQTQIILNTWSVISTINDETVGTLFYNRLFEVAPELRSLFKSPIPEQSKKLMAMLHYLIRNLNKPDELGLSLSNLAQRHVNYNVKAEYYNIVGSALIWTLEQGLGNLWNEAAQEAWISLYTHVSNVMIDASAKKQAA